jgi:catechol 2,3-dioxygenase-like lactoylglutathione lyase family enzyme
MKGAFVQTFHLSLDVPDLDGAVSFYRSLLGVEPAKLRPGYAKFELADPPVAVALQQASASRLNHLGIRVDDQADVDAASVRLRSAGLLDSEERDTVCCYARQDKVWAHDPSGVPWEIYTVLEDVDAVGVADACCAEAAAIATEEDASGRSCCDPACCAA